MPNNEVHKNRAFKLTSPKGEEEEEESVFMKESL
jgi:hypothetical protein